MFIIRKKFVTFYKNSIDEFSKLGIHEIEVDNEYFNNILVEYRELLSDSIAFNKIFVIADMDYDVYDENKNKAYAYISDSADKTNNRITSIVLNNSYEQITAKAFVNIFIDKLISYDSQKKWYIEDILITKKNLAEIIKKLHIIDKV